MEDTIIDNLDSNQNKDQVTENVEYSTKKKLRFNNLTEEQKKVLMGGSSALAGMMMGAGAFVLMGFADKDGEIASVPNDDANECVDVYTDAPIATTVSHDMSFSEAFRAARNEIGAGGFFTYKGQVYNTYTKEEWDTMSDLDKNDYANSLAGKVHEVREVQEVNSEVDAVVPNAENAENDNQNAAENQKEEVDADAKLEDEPIEGAKEEGVAEAQKEVEPLEDQKEEVEEVIENEHDAPDLVKESDVISRVDVNSDYTIDAYEVDFDKDEYADFVVDIDGDGKFDELILDMNNPEASGEVIDISPLDTSKLTETNLVDGDGNMLHVRDEQAIGKSNIANDTIEVSSDDLVDGMDLDGDGQVESFIIDANNNYVDDVAIDLDNSGTVDVVIMDVDSIDTDARIDDAFSEVEVDAVIDEDVDEPTVEVEGDFVENEMDDNLSDDLTDELSDDLSDDFSDDDLLLDA